MKEKNETINDLFDHFVSKAIKALSEIFACMYESPSKQSEINVLKFRK